MLPILAVEDDSSPTLDLHRESIPETDGSMDLGVEVGEGFVHARRVVRGSTIEYPLIELSICVRTELGNTFSSLSSTE